MKSNIEDLIKELNTVINKAAADKSVSDEVCVALIKQRQELTKILELVK